MHKACMHVPCACMSSHACKSFRAQPGKGTPFAFPCLATYLDGPSPPNNALGGRRPLPGACSRRAVLHPGSMPMCMLPPSISVLLFMVCPPLMCQRAPGLATTHVSANLLRATIACLQPTCRAGRWGRLASTATASPCVCPPRCGARGAAAAERLQRLPHRVCVLPGAGQGVPQQRERLQRLPHTTPILL